MQQFDDACQTSTEWATTPLYDIVLLALFDQNSEIELLKRRYFINKVHCSRWIYKNCRKVSIMIAFEIHWNTSIWTSIFFKQATNKLCNRLFIKKTLFKVEFPNFPHNTVNKANCSWNFVTSELEFCHFLDLHITQLFVRLNCDLHAIYIHSLINLLIKMQKSEQNDTTVSMRRVVHLQSPWKVLHHAYPSKYWQNFFGKIRK